MRVGPHDGISALIRRGRERHLSLPHEDTERRHHLQTRRRGLTGT